LRGTGARAVGDVVRALHLDQPRDGAAELEGAVADGVDLLGRCRVRGDQQSARFVKHLNQDDESAGGVVLFGTEPRDSFNHDRREIFGDREAIGGGKRPLAESSKAEPGTRRAARGRTSARPLTAKVALSPNTPAVNSAKAAARPLIAQRLPESVGLSVRTESSQTAARQISRSPRRAVPPHCRRVRRANLRFG
jgi:hypothetical protein